MIVRRFFSALTAIASFVLIAAYCAMPVQAQNAGEPLFAARVVATYTVQPDGTTRVKLQIRLRNTTSLQYAQQYALRVNSPDVDDAQAIGADGKPLPVDVAKTPMQTNLTVQFPKDAPVVGRDQERLFTLEYTSRDAASRYGEVLEVTVPRLADPDFYEQYSVIVVVPQQFGEPAWVRPEQYTLDKLPDVQIVRFTDVAKSGVSILFGQQQTYNVSLRYHVNNPSQNTGIVEVALPPDTPWQQVWYESLSPKPESVRADADGNWIAQFKLAGQATQDIVASGQAVLHANPVVPVPQTSPLLEQQSPWWKGAEGSPWLAGQSYWQKDHALIKQASAENASAQSIYDFVVETLQYNPARAREVLGTGRLGAVGALQDPSNALCQEYTDVFIALSRSAGIPARRVTGYAVNQSSALRPLSLVTDVLHAWPEYYDVQRGQWIPVDPTWGDTTGGVDYFNRFDLRHIVFARQGTSDTSPLAAGQYKVGGELAQDVVVQVATASAVPAQSTLTLKHEPVLRFAWPGQPRKVKVIVENTSGLARYNTVVTSVATGADMAGETTWNIPSILPYQTVSTELELSGRDWFAPTPVTLSSTLDEQTTTYELSVRRAIQHPILRQFALGGVVALLSLGAGSVSVFGLRRLRPVRRKSKKS
jgi:transglutaminase-like putative cysteine protease